MYKWSVSFALPGSTWRHPEVLGERTLQYLGKLPKKDLTMKMSWIDAIRNRLVRRSARHALLEKAQPWRPGQQNRRRIRKLSQEIVDRILLEEALPLSGAFARQENIRTELFKNPADKERLLNLLEAYGNAIDRVKARFWEAHRLAQVAGFCTKPKIEDYF